jgi:predicted transcriptional regulator
MGKVKIHGPRKEEMKRDGKTYSEIAQEVGLAHSQVKEYFKRRSMEARHRGYRRSKKADALKTNQVLRGEIKSLRMEVVLLRDFAEELGRM